MRRLLNLTPTHAFCNDVLIMASWAVYSVIHSNLYCHASCHCVTSVTLVFHLTACDLMVSNRLMTALWHTCRTCVTVVVADVC